MTTDRELLGPELHKPVTHAVLIDAVSLYRRHFRLFTSLVVLPTFAGVFFQWAAQAAIAHLVRNLSRVPDLRNLEVIRNSHIVLQASLIRTGGFLGLWLCWAFAFTGVTVAVVQVLRGDTVGAEECLNRTREKPMRFLISSGYLFLKMALLTFILGAVGFMWWVKIAEYFNIELTFLPGYLIGLTQVILIAAFTLPFLLAVPVSVMEDQGLLQSLKKSFALTEGKSIVMLGLFLEAEISAYLLAWLLYRIAYSGASGYGFRALQGSIYYIQIVASAFLQPIAMIGFAWIYAARTHEPTELQAEHERHAIPTQT